MSNLNLLAQAEAFRPNGLKICEPLYQAKELEGNGINKVTHDVDG